MFSLLNLKLVRRKGVAASESSPVMSSRVAAVQYVEIGQILSEPECSSPARLNPSLIMNLRTLASH